MNDVKLSINKLKWHLGHHTRHFLLKPSLGLVALLIGLILHNILHRHDNQNVKIDMDTHLALTKHNSKWDRVPLHGQGQILTATVGIRPNWAYKFKDSLCLVSWKWYQRGIQEYNWILWGSLTPLNIPQWFQTLLVWTQCKFSPLH